MRLNVLPRQIASFGMTQELADVQRSILVTNGTSGPKFTCFWQNCRILVTGKRGHVPPAKHLIGGSIQCLYEAIEERLVSLCRGDLHRWRRQCRVNVIWILQCLVRYLSCFSYDIRVAPDQSKSFEKVGMERL